MLIRLLAFPGLIAGPDAILEADPLRALGKYSALQQAQSFLSWAIPGLFFFIFVFSI